MNVDEKRIICYKTLQEICEKEDSLQLKLNFDLLESRSGNRKEDFFHFEDGKLVGFLGSYYFGNKVEICGMVHPNYRRRGVFTSLLEMVFEEVKKREARTILLIHLLNLKLQRSFSKNIPCTLAMVEYQMKWQNREMADDHSITVRPSFSSEDTEAEIQLDVQCFGLNEREARQYKQETKYLTTDQRLIIEADEKLLGKCVFPK